MFGEEYTEQGFFKTCVSVNDLDDKCVRVNECLVHLFPTRHFLL